MGFWTEINKKVDELEGKTSFEPVFNKSKNGAHIYDDKKICPGYRFFEGKLITVDGTIVKDFQHGHLGVFSKEYFAGQKGYEVGPWSVVDTKGKTLFRKFQPIHHECFFYNNLIITFDKEVQTYRGRQVDFDIVVAIGLDGLEKWRWSTWDNLQELKKHHRMMELDIPFIPISRKKKSPWGGEVDYYRINSLQFLPKTKLGKTDKRFAEGNWLLTLRHGSLLLILDKNTKKVVWKLSQKDILGEIQGPHGAQLLDNGNILVLDNGRYRGWSRAIEFNPLTKEIMWEYKAEDFFTNSQGYVQRLPNGNTLITQAEKGRAFEVTRDCEIVWEYYYPQKQTKENSPEYKESWGSRKWMYRMIWYAKDDVTPFLD